MKSPFPGMDPFLERHWEDVHTRLIGYIADTIQPQLAEDLIARMEEKVYVQDEGARQLRRPDVRVVERPTPWEPEAGAVATAVLDEPIFLEPLFDPQTERSVLILDAVGNRIVTAIEVLSPWNKSPEKGVKAYLEKREKYIASSTNLVEIDLVRTGNWTEMIGSYRVPEQGLTTYRVTVTQADMPLPYQYPIPMSARLPTIKIPLRPHDEPAKLNLQELIEKAYAMGRYDRIEYDKPCYPPLKGAEEVWTNEVLKVAEKR